MTAVRRRAGMAHERTRSRRRVAGRWAGGEWAAVERLDGRADGRTGDTDCIGWYRRRMGFARRRRRGCAGMDWFGWGFGADLVCRVALRGRAAPAHLLSAGWPHQKHKVRGLAPLRSLSSSPHFTTRIQQNEQHHPAFAQQPGCRSRCRPVRGGQSVPFLPSPAWLQADGPRTAPDPDITLSDRL